MQKATAKLIEGLEIQHNGDKFHVSIMIWTSLGEGCNIGLDQHWRSILNST